jgi:hypothetical protein
MRPPVLRSGMGRTLPLDLSIANGQIRRELAACLASDRRPICPIAEVPAGYRATATWDGKRALEPNFYTL